MFFLPIFAIISISLFGSVYAQNANLTQEQMNEMYNEINTNLIQLKRINSVVDTCTLDLGPNFDLCVSFLKKMNQKNVELFNETKADMETILYGIN
ncbi:MAG: hypothetical protein CV087_10205 [Candidatus Brocadia sp. WS118]|nr:MAG: hypothetical protein CV087_10205 [Candidatus Brocadia sp. WS118]